MEKMIKVFYVHASAKTGEWIDKPELVGEIFQSVFERIRESDEYRLYYFDRAIESAEYDLDRFKRDGEECALLVFWIKETE